MNTDSSDAVPPSLNRAPQVVLAEDPRDGLKDLACQAAAVQDPWARHWLVVPGQGRPEWLQQEWARHTGIASRSQVLKVRAVVELAAAGDADQQVFQTEALALAIAECLPDYAHRLPMDQLLDAGKAIDGLQLAWARQLADAMDTGLLCRSDPATRFASAPFLAEMVQDERLQAPLQRHLGAMDADTFAQQVNTFMAHWEAREGLPYLWFYLDGGLPAVLWQRLTQLLARYPSQRVGVVALSPSLQFWADLRPRHRRTAADEALQPGPVLYAFGTRSQDLHRQLCDTYLETGDGGRELAAQRESTQLLGRLQRSCRDLERPQMPARLSADDHSFSVHGCRSPLRELEVVRDRILQALDEDPDLSPDQVLVLLVDSPTQAPLVGAAFAGSGEPRSHLPFRLIAGQGTEPAPLADGLRALWRALGDRCDREDLLSLLENPLIRARFGLSDQDPATLMQWLEDACFTWGIDGEQRVHFQGVLGDRRHLTQALRRLALGAVVDPAQLQEVVTGEIPLERATGLAAAALAGLAALLEALHAHRGHWSAGAVATGRNWCAQLRALIDDCLGEPTEAQLQQQRSQVLDQLIPRLERQIPASLSLTVDAFLRLLGPELEQLGQQFGSGGGGVVVAPLREWAGRPAAMVCICGLSEGVFPRADDRPTWHPLAGPRQEGDAGRRDDDRHALLLALLAAERRLVCTYESGSQLDDKERPPSTPLADLLEAARACCDADDFKGLSHHHLLNGFSPDSVAATSPVSGRSYLPHEAQAARSLLQYRSNPAPQGGLWSAALPRSNTQAYSLSLLIKAAKRPYECFLNALGMVVPEESEALLSCESLSLDNHLDRWKMRDRLLEQLVAGVDLTALGERMRLSGQLGPGRYGDSDWQSAVNLLPPIAALGEKPQPIESLVHITAAEWQIDGTLQQRWFVAPDNAGIIGLSASKLEPIQRKPRDGLAWEIGKALPLAIETLTLVAQGNYHGTARIFHCKGGMVSMALPEPETAQQALAAWCELVTEACRVPIPWSAEAHKVLVKNGNGGLLTVDIDDDVADKWDGDDFSEVPAGAQYPSAKMCFRGLNEHPSQWLGPPADLALPGSDQPLMQRWAAAVQQWYGDYLGDGFMKEIQKD